MTLQLLLPANSAELWLTLWALLYRAPLSPAVLLSEPPLSVWGTALESELSESELSAELESESELLEESKLLAELELLVESGLLAESELSAESELLVEPVLELELWELDTAMDLFKLSINQFILGAAYSTSSHFILWEGGFCTVYVL